MRLLVAIALCVVSMTVQAAGLTVKGITLGAPAPVSLLGRLPGSNGVLADTYFGLPAKLLVNIDQQGKVNIVTFLIQGNAFHGLAAELTQKYGKPDTDAGSFAWAASDTQVLLLPPHELGGDAQITFTYIGGPKLDPKDS